MENAEVKKYLDQSHERALRSIVGDPLVDEIKKAGLVLRPAEVRYVLESRAAFYTRVVLVSDDHNEEDLCYRWLASRRDYPYYRCDPPPVRPQIMRACVAEFCRSNPGFTL